MRAASFLMLAFASLTVAARGQFLGDTSGVQVEVVLTAARIKVLESVPALLRIRNGGAGVLEADRYLFGEGYEGVTLVLTKPDGKSATVKRPQLKDVPHPAYTPIKPGQHLEVAMNVGADWGILKPLFDVPGKYSLTFQYVVNTEKRAIGPFAVEVIAPAKEDAAGLELLKAIPLPVAIYEPSIVVHHAYATSKAAIEKLAALEPPGTYGLYARWVLAGNKIYETKHVRMSDEARKQMLIEASRFLDQIPDGSFTHGEGVRRDRETVRAGLDKK